jgi:hypothetical protein
MGSTLGGRVAGSGARRASGRWPLVLAGVCAVLLLAATLEIVIDGSLGRSALVPVSPTIAGWMEGLGERLGYRVFLIALLTYTGAYAGILALVRGTSVGRISARWAIALTAALNLIVFVGPVLLSTDVFSYIAYARMGVLHGVNPYLHGPLSINSDPITPYVGNDWRRVATAYGPLYTLISYPLAWLGVVGALWGAKLQALVASFGTLALTWRCARQRGIVPAKALLVVGVNPLYVLYGLGGAHNDLIMTLFMMAAVNLTIAGREASGAASVIAGALVKVTMVALLPFMLLGSDLKQIRSSRAGAADGHDGGPAPATAMDARGPRSIAAQSKTPLDWARRWRTLLGALGAVVLAAAISYPVFGLHGLNVVAALNRDAALVSKDSFPTEIAHMLGKPGVFPVDHDLLKVALVAIVVHLLWRTWRGYDWVAASGWTLLAIAVTSTWLLAWYTLWSLPLAVVARDRRLLVATLAVQGLFIVHQLAPLIYPVS